MSPRQLNGVTVLNLDNRDTLEYRPKFVRDRKPIRGGYDTPAHDEGAPDTPPIPIDSTDNPDYKEVLDWALTSDEIDNVFQELDVIISDQTKDMKIPVSDPNVSRSVKYISDGDHDNYIDQNDWNISLSIRNSTHSILNTAHEYDLGEVIWNEIKIRIADWLAGLLERIPIVGDELRDRLMTHAEAARAKSIQAAVRKDDLYKPLGVGELAGTVSDKSLLSLTHADRLLNYIDNYLSTPGPTNFNPAAIDIKPVVDGINSNWKSTREIINTSYGIVITKETPQGSITDQVKSEWRDVISPISDARKYVRDITVTSDLWKYGVVNTRSEIMGIRNVLRAYTLGKGLACCLLDNILGVSEVVSGGDFKFLKLLRLGLLYSFNGLHLSTGSIYNTLADILNQAIMIAMGKIMSTLQTALENRIVGLRNYLRDFAARKGESWRRCYPFDELMDFAITGLYDIESDLLSYLNDYTNTLKLSHVSLNKYLIQIKKREYSRRMIQLVDLLVKGIETGIICKELGDMESPKYSRPTPEELDQFINNYSSRISTDINQAQRRYARAPVSGKPVEAIGFDEGSYADLSLIQNCDVSLTSSELEELKDGLRRLDLV